MSRPSYNAQNGFICLASAAALTCTTSLSAQIEVLRDSSEIGDTGVFLSPWLGVYSQSEPTSPWIFSDMIGWSYTVDDVQDGAAWLYNEELEGWFWTTTEIFPYAYSETSEWIYFERIEPLSYVYDFEDGNWTAIEKSWYSPDLNSQERAARFLAQASLGANLDTINTVTLLGLERWIDAQFEIPVSRSASPVNTLIAEADSNAIDLDYRALLFREVWWKTVLTGTDLLRQRIVLALSEILVISDQPDLGEHPEGLASYYDVLQNNAFGNYRDLLYEITTHPTMGLYLSHLGNRPPDASTGRFPDENYAREVMQLFTIGLFELNLDGSLKLDSDNNPIPTFDNTDITEFARVYTGMNFDLRDELETLAEERGIPNPPTVETITFAEIREYGITNYAEPMYFYEREHDKDSKQLLNGTILPAGQSIEEDLNGAMDNLFNHPSTPPFVSKLLIQRLTKSNPSRAYIERVASTFVDNGQGVRGDMKAIIKAILLDVEARSPDMLKDTTHAKMREPYFRLIHYMRAFDARPAGEDYFLIDTEYNEAFGQRPFSSPSVFNFFLPDYAPPGTITDNGLVAPEFQIADSFSLSASLNILHTAIVGDRIQIAEASEENIALGLEKYIPTWSVDLSEEIALANDLDALLDHLDLIITYGNLSDSTRALIKDALTGFQEFQNTDDERMVRLAIYLLITSPDYSITR